MGPIDGPREASLEIPVDRLADLCRGHFRDDPLVPGAYQLGLGVELASLVFGTVHRVRRAGFRAPLRPDGHAVVRASHDAERGQTRVEVSNHLKESTARFELVEQPSQIQPFEIEDSKVEIEDCPPDDLLDRARIAASLRHEQPALFLAEQIRGSARAAEFTALERPAWHWAEVLDGAAQAAGLCLRRSTRREGAPIYVAAYEQVMLTPDHPISQPMFRVELVRRVMGLTQFRFVVVDAAYANRACLAGTVALADAAGEPRR